LKENGNFGRIKKFIYYYFEEREYMSMYSSIFGIIYCKTKSNFLNYLLKNNFDKN